MGNDNFITLDLVEAYKDLGSGVVKVLFLTKDKRVREMWATRNYIRTKLHDHFWDKDGVMEEEIDKGYINVFDLQKKSYRKIPMDRVLKWESFDNRKTVPPISTNKSELYSKSNLTSKIENVF